MQTNIRSSRICTQGRVANRSEWNKGRTLCGSEPVYCSLHHTQQDSRLAKTIKYRTSVALLDSFAINCLRPCVLCAFSLQTVQVATEISALKFMPKTAVDLLNTAGDQDVLKPFQMTGRHSQMDQLA